MSAPTKIEIKAYATRRQNNVTTGIVEITMPNQYFRKYVSFAELKSLTNSRGASDKRKMEKWLNTEEGLKWATEQPHKQLF